MRGPEGAGQLDENTAAAVDIRELKKQRTDPEILIKSE
jgi:hypothetical protein